MSGHEQVASCTGFEWDDANVQKIWARHEVTPAECERVFFNQPLVIADDPKHSQDEPRFYALGQSDAGRRLFVVFTIRAQLMRVISARDMSRKERKAYEAGKEETAKIQE